ncbi:MAG: hypothetical protein C5B43_04670 [Verrucomicrobia bacterium]|nr:MAG: hypothetical protein C5B43_04670 [Verrucomicrobiota bacterium]
MKLITKSPVFFLKLFFIFQFSCITLCYSESFSKCFPEKFSFICDNPNDFLLRSGVNIENNIIEQARLRLLEEKFDGGCHGGIYQGNHNTYFIKRSNVFTEFIGSKLMNLIVGKTCTPTVRLVKDQVNCVASEKLRKFSNKKEFKKKVKRKHLSGEVDITIAMDYLGIVDRHSKNIGYVKLRKKKLLAARVDFDASFAFEIRPRANSTYKENSNHKNLNLLYLSMQTFPEHQVRSAIQKIVNIPDEKIILTVFECWATFNKLGYVISSESCFALAHKLIERKMAFKTVLDDPNSVTYASLEADPMFKKLFKKLKKNKHKKKSRYIN